MLTFITLFLCLFACRTPQSANDGIIRGELVWVTGNQMPGPDREPTTNGKPIQRVVVIYPPVNWNDCTVGEQGLYVEIPGEPVNTVLSDSTGLFMTHLPPGMYSVFTREENGLFASLMNGEGIINPVTIQRRDTTEIRIEINYTAAY